MEQSFPSEISLHDYRSASAVQKRNIDIVPKLQLLLKPNENWLPSACEEMWKSQHCVPKQLTLENMSVLENENYFISLKADGTPVALYCDIETGSFHKISSTFGEFSNSSIDGSRSKIGGFLIDAEEVVISPGCVVFLAYDLLAIDFAALSYFGMTDFVKSDLTNIRKPKMIGSIIERHRVLGAIVSQSNLPNLIVKPIYNAHECADVWKIKEKFPYPVDGLIFSPPKQIRQKNTCFHLNCSDTFSLPTLKWKPLEDLTLDVAVGDVSESNDSTSYSNVYLYKPNAKRGIPINHIKHVRHSQHVLFDFTVSDTSTPLQFTEVVEDSCIQIQVPKKDSLWAPFSIVEGLLDIQHQTMQFKRIRRDRKQANTIAEANEIISAIMSAIKLSDLKFSVKNPSGSLAIQSFNECLLYRLPQDKHTSCFLNLREMHFRIKGILYRLYGGNSIIDAACGGLPDMDNWIVAGIKDILALEKNKMLVAQAKERLKAGAARRRNFKCDVLAVDLAVPQNLSCSQKSSIFCNFAIHHFWDSEENTSAFFNNLIPILMPQGYFVVTYMNGDYLPRDTDVQILNERGLLEFGARFINSKVISVVSSKGRSFEESVITPRILEERFESAGCRHLKTLPFRKLRLLFPVIESKMTDEEKRMSDFYAASIFQKCEITVQTGELFRLPDTCHMEMISFCDLESLFCLRKTCNHFRCLVDDASRRSWRSRNMESHNHQKTSLLSTAYGIGIYVRLKGSLKVHRDKDNRIWDSQREQESLDHEHLNYEHSGLERWDYERWGPERWDIESSESDVSYSYFTDFS